MGLGALYSHEVKALVLGGVTLAVRGAQQQTTINYMHLSGVLAMAEYICTTRQVSWTEFLEDARRQLGEDSVALLDHALMVEPETAISQ